MTSYEDLALHAWQGAEAAVERETTDAASRGDEGDPRNPRDRTPQQKLARARRLVAERREELAAAAAAKQKTDRGADRDAEVDAAAEDVAEPELSAREMVDAGRLPRGSASTRVGASRDPSTMAAETLDVIESRKDVDEMSPSEMLDAAGHGAKPTAGPTFRAGHRRNASRKTRD